MKTKEEIQDQIETLQLSNMSIHEELYRIECKRDATEEDINNHKRLLQQQGVNNKLIQFAKWVIE